MIHNFKYHSVADLERLIENLREEITHLKMTVELNNATYQQRLALKESEDMLVHAEYEVLERTLLQVGNEGGCSD